MIIIYYVSIADITTVFCSVLYPLIGEKTQYIFTIGQKITIRFTFSFGTVIYSFKNIYILSEQLELEIVFVTLYVCTFESVFF